jgi:hypothetical protein
MISKKNNYYKNMHMQPAYHSCQDAAYAAGIILSLPATLLDVLLRIIDRERYIRAAAASGKQPSPSLASGAGSSSKRPCTPSTLLFFVQR